MTQLDQLRPFHASALDVAEREASLSGDLPDWLRGELTRGCPAVFTRGRWKARHWFYALCMLYAFRIGPSGVRYQSRLLDSQVAGAARDGRSPFGAFDSPIERSFWTRLVQPVPPLTDNANVNVVALGEQRVALTESPTQVVFDPRTLEVRGEVEYTDGLPAQAPMSAHPQYDFARREVVNTLLGFGAAPNVSFYRHAPDARRRELFARYQARRLPYVHSFGLSSNHVFLVAHPFDVNPLRLLWSNAGFIEAFAWRPEAGTRIAVYDRASGAEQIFETDPMFVFHTAHAFEEKGEMVLDVVDWGTPDIVSALRTERLVDGALTVGTRLVRLRMTPGTARARVEPLTDVKIEFPTVAYRHVAGRAQRFVWGASILRDRAAVVKLDVVSGRTLEFAEPDLVFGEPVLVARPGSSDEDDGVVLSVGSSRTLDRTVLAVLDARTLDVRARAEIDVSVPLGFHGSFFRAPAT